MNMPVEIINCVHEIVEKNKKDPILDVISQAICEVRNLDCFEEAQEILVNSAIQDLVYDVRHKINVKIKNDNNSYSKSAFDKTSKGRAAVERVALTVFDYKIF